MNCDSSTQVIKARRPGQLVWMAEKLAYFAEFFADAEAILFRLALAEIEPHLGNSASRIWAALFRVALSGTSVPFAERLELLERRFNEGGSSGLPLAVAALDEILTDGPVSRLAAPPVVFGRVPPEQWRPADRETRRACRSQALAVAGRLVAAGGPIAESVRSIVIGRLSTLLLQGFLDEVQVVIGSAALPDVTLAQLGNEVERFLDVFCRDHQLPLRGLQIRTAASGGDESGTKTAETVPTRATSAELESRVREWYQRLVPTGLHGRLVSVVGLDSWNQQVFGKEDAWERALENLAADLLRSPAAFAREREWLCSRAARSAFHLGQALGEADRGGALLDQMLWDLPIAGELRSPGDISTALRRITRADVNRMNHLLDRLQSEHPRLAYEIIWSAGDELRKVDRLLQMVDCGSLPAEYLAGLGSGVRDRPLSIDELLQAEERLVRAARDATTPAAPAAAQLLFSWLRSPGQFQGIDSLAQNSAFWDTFTSVLQLATDVAGNAPVPWARLVDDLATVDPNQAVELAVRVLVADDYSARELAEDCLLRLAASHPTEVMYHVGNAMLHPATGWRFRVHDFSLFLSSLPFDIVRDWLLAVGVEGDRGLARHLGPPQLDAEGQPVVPPLTAFVLEQFADDDQVFNEFFAGSRSTRSYQADVATRFDQEVEVARHFLNHRSRRVRESGARRDRSRAEGISPLAPV